MKKILITIAVLTLPITVSAQTRVSLSADYASFSIGIEDHVQGFRWYFVSAEAEHQFRKAWLPGFSVGILKESKKNEYGTYLTLKLFRAFDLKHFSIIPSGGFIYGLPGIQFDRTRLIYADGEVVGYKNVSMIRHINITQTGIDTAGVLQPITEVRIRRYLGRYFLESHSNIRFGRFAKVSSDFRDAIYEEDIILMPSVGMGIGFTF